MYIVQMNYVNKICLNQTKICLSNIDLLINDEIFKRWKNDPGRHPFCKHTSSKGDVIKTQCWKFREMVI